MSDHLLTEAADLLDACRFEDDGACCSCRRTPDDIDGFEGIEINHAPDCIVTRLRLRASSQPMADSGWRMVPSVPTEAMIDAGRDKETDTWGAGGDCQTIWEAMLASAPPPPGETPAPQGKE